MEKENEEQEGWKEEDEEGEWTKKEEKEFLSRLFRSFTPFLFLSFSISPTLFFLPVLLLLLLLHHLLLPPLSPNFQYVFILQISGVVRRKIRVYQTRWVSQIQIKAAASGSAKSYSNNLLPSRGNHIVNKKNKKKKDWREEEKKGRRADSYREATRIILIRALLGPLDSLILPAHLTHSHFGRGCQGMQQRLSFHRI